LNRIHKFFDDGRVELIAGSGAAAFTADGASAKTAALIDPQGLAVTPGGEVIFSEIGSRRIRMVTNAGVLKTLAGTGAEGNSGDGGPALNATLTAPFTLALGPDQSLYFADEFAHVVRRITTDGKISRVAGTGVARYADSGNPRALSEPSSVFVAANGTVYVGEFYRGVKQVMADGTFRQVTSAGDDLMQSAVQMVRDMAQAAANGQVSPYKAVLANRPNYDGIAISTAGTLYTNGPHGVIVYDQNGVKTPFAGAPVADAVCGVENSAHLTQIYEPSALAYGPNQTLYLTDWLSFTADKLVVRSFYSVQGSAKSRNLYGCQNEPQLVATNPLSTYSGSYTNLIGTMQVGKDGTIYQSNMSRNLVFRIGADGVPVTIAGTGASAPGADGGLAINTPLQMPIGLTLGPDGSIYLVEYSSTADPNFSAGSRIRQITPDGRITTLAGTGGDGDSGEGGPARLAQLRANTIAMSPDGRLFIADYGNHKVKMVDRQGVIQTIAGGGTITDLTTPIDGRQARLYLPSSISVTNDGVVYVVSRASLVQLKQNAQSLWEASTFFGVATANDCGVGRISGQATAGKADEAIKASMSVICQGDVRSVAIRDTCPATDGLVRIAIGQSFDNFVNIVEVQKPCGS
jgi:hypothetical protein